MRKTAIILDLDHTIFNTNSIDNKTFDSFFENLVSNIKPLFSDDLIENIVADLWKVSWDEVIEKYKIPKDIFMKSISVLEKSPFNFDISTYSDYQYLKKYSINKFLVTTGLTSLQKAKIKALNIENDFTEILINDQLIESKTKYNLFQEIITNYNLIPEKTYVIGDNPNSEIRAGNKLNLITIQIVRDKIVKGNNANFYINSFEELKNIIKK